MLSRQISSFRNKLKRKKIEPSEKSFKKFKVFLSLLIIIIFLATLPLGIEFYKFSTTTSYTTSKLSKINETYNTLLLGVDEEEGVVFIDAITVLVVDKDQSHVGIVNLSPDIIIQGETLRRGLVSDKKNLDKIISSVEEVLTIKLNSYIVFDEVSFKEVSRYTKGVSLQLDSEIKDPDVYLEGKSLGWPKGSAGVGSCCYYEFLKSDSEGISDKLDRQLKLYKDYTNSIPVSKIFLGYADIAKVIKTVNTSLNKYELVDLFYFVYSFTPTNIKTAYTKEDYLTFQKKLGIYDSFTLNKDRFDQDLKPLIISNEIVLEQSVVEVLNASGQGGLANEKSRWMKSSGMNVIHIANAPIYDDRSKLYVPNKEKYKNTIDKLISILGNNVEVIESEYPYRHIGEIVVLLGKDQVN